MRFVSSYFEFPWAVALGVSYFAAAFNSANSKHLENVVPPILWLVALSASFFLLRGYDHRQESLFPFLRFFGFGSLATLALFYIWGEYGTVHLGPGALGLAGIYGIYIVIGLVVLGGLTIFEAIHCQVHIPKKEFFFIFKGVAGLSVLLICGYGVLQLSIKSRIGPGQANTLVEDWQANRAGVSNLQMNCGETPDEIKISLRTDALRLWQKTPSEVHDLMKDAKLVLALEQFLEKVLQNEQVFSKQQVFPAGWKVQITASQDSESLWTSTRVDASNLSRKTWDDSLRDLEQVGENRGDIPLNWIASAFVRQYENSGDRTAFLTACFEIAAALFKDENASVFTEVKNAFDARDKEFFSEVRILKYAATHLKVAGSLNLKIQSLRLLRFAIASEL